MDKSGLRKLYLEKRRGLSSAETKNMSLAIVNSFSTLNLDDVKYLHIFYPITGKSEFNSLLLADYIRDKYPEIKLVLSKSDLNTHTLSHYIWDNNTSLAMNQWGITEPVNGISVNPQQIDLVLVPLLAFDKKGNRVGYGKGFYDRFLSDCRKDTIKAGISFFPPGEEIQDIDQHDVPLDLCITPEKIWDFNLKG